MACKGGYDYEFLSPPPKNMECSVCLLTLKDPHVISCCGNHYCKACIDRVQGDSKPCPLCNDPDYSTMLHKGVKREVESLAVYCPQKSLGCDWTGEIRQVQCHLNFGSKDSGCGYVVIECEHQCGGKFQRREIVKHESQECSDRPADVQLDLLASQLTSVLIESRKVGVELTEKIDAIVRKNGDLEARCKTIESRNNELETRNTSLEVAMQDLKGKVDTMESERQMLKNRVSMLESLAMKVFHIETRQNRQSHRLDKVEEAMKKDRFELGYMCTSLETQLTPTPPFYFTLWNFEHYRNVDFHWQSEPFYPFPKGYKLNAIVYPNGTSKGVSTHLSLFVSILHGEYDDQLEWPFKGTIYIELYDYTTNSWNSNLPAVEFEESDNIKSTGRPTSSHSNPGLGFPKWVFLEDVRQRYCHKGMIRFRVAKIDVSSYPYLDVQ